MVADSFTKYIAHDKWVRHMHYILNLPGDPLNCHDDNWVKVVKKNRPKRQESLMTHGSFIAVSNGISTMPQRLHSRGGRGVFGCGQT